MDSIWNCSKWRLRERSYTYGETVYKKIDKLSALKGTYALIIEVKKDIKVEIGALGKVRINKGYYAYIGSAMGSLRTRIKRHLSKNKKKMHWHIDYLLKHAKPIGVAIWISSKEKLEYTVANKLKEKVKFVPKFGSSDSPCISHLFFCKQKEVLLENISKVLKRTMLYIEF